MKQQSSPIDDLKHIRQMMEESSKFLSLSGLSGIAVGTVALIGAAVAHFYILDSGAVKYDEYLRVLPGYFNKGIRISMILTALVVLVAALTSAWYISYRKSRKLHIGFWTPSTKNMVYGLLSVLVTGGLFCLILIYQGYFRIIASVMLLFYGIALINASKYSKQDIKTLGYTEILLGLLAALWLNHGLLFWTIGFGLVHIVYGILMYVKYDLKAN